MTQSCPCTLLGRLAAMDSGGSEPGSAKIGIEIIYDGYTMDSGEPEPGSARIGVTIIFDG